MFLVRGALRIPLGLLAIPGPNAEGEECSKKSLAEIYSIFAPLGVKVPHPNVQPLPSTRIERLDQWTLFAN